MADACDPEVFRQGHAILVCGSTEKETMEDLIAKLKTPTVLFDWHYMGGVPILLYLGPYTEAVSVLAQHLDWFNDRRWEDSQKEEWTRTHIRHFGLEDAKARHYRYKVEDFAAPAMKSLGQCLNAEKM